MFLIKSFQFYSNGIYTEPDCSDTNLNHTGTIVGYDSIRNKFDKNGYYGSNSIRAFTVTISKEKSLRLSLII